MITKFGKFCSCIRAIIWTPSATTWGSYPSRGSCRCFGNEDESMKGMVQRNNIKDAAPQAHDCSYDTCNLTQRQQLWRSSRDPIGNDEGTLPLTKQLHQQ
jgi:hypothetical protein